MSARTAIGPTLAIAGRDVRAIGASAFGVGTMAGTAALSGAVLVVDLRAGQARLDQWFGALIVLVGLLSVLVATRSFSEEERRGSLELVLTAPVSRAQVAVGKLCGTWAVLVGAVVATVGCPILVAMVGHPDGGPIVTGYVGLLAAAVAFAALAAAASAATSNPLTGAAAGAAVLLALWASGVVTSGGRGRLHDVLTGLSPTTHITGFLRGTLALPDLVYFGLLAVFGLGATITVLSWRR
jgi:ABC-2 type transport system permease protein